MIRQGLYKHYKGGYYQVIDSARHSETEELLVVYRTLYGERDLWVRPFGMFTEKIDVDGEMVERFSFVREIKPGEAIEEAE